MMRLLAALLLIVAPAVADAAERVASGTFDIKMSGDPATQLAMAKTYSGALAGKGTGPFVGDTKVMVYVALETFQGTLEGRTGGFIMMHRGWQGADKVNHLDVVIAPNSGTGELAGITGTLAIRIDANGTHPYRLTSCPRDQQQLKHPMPAPGAMRSWPPASALASSPVIGRTVRAASGTTFWLKACHVVCIVSIG